ncbi:MAG: hypothetical protein NC225_00930 [Clostridium sp.]|nr:hypothetical protein [Clostridium sp.]MCM1398024.1 hypothetical protein [Clostridium sp.]MCM1459340.1 hypothetical protein [Bacteroides sp.]
MLHVILLILKILLWIIFGLVSLVLLLVLLVLFVPITYRADIKIDDNATVAAKVRFLVVSVGLCFDKNAKQFDTAIRVLGIRLGGGKKSTRKVKADVEEAVWQTDELAKDVPDEDANDMEDTVGDGTEEANADDMQDDAGETDAGDTAFDAEDKEIEHDAGTAVYNADRSDTGKQEQIPETDDTVKQSGHEEEAENKKAKKKKKDKQKKKTKDRDAEPEKESVLDKVNGKLAYIKKKLNRVGKFWDLPCTVKLRTYLKKYIPGLLRHIGPRKVEGHVRYGFQEPCKTGQVTGYLSLMPFVYQKNFYLHPDFYNKILEGEVKLKGRLMLGYILRIALNMNVWRTIKAMRKI